MKRVIRKNTFETNSSSTHAICICTDKRLLEDVKYPNHLYFGIGEHGWEFETLSTPEDKANYLYTAILELYEKDYSEKINVIFEWLGDIGCESEFEKPIWHKSDNWMWLKNGGIDHYDQTKNFVEAVLRNKKLLLNYLFSDNSFVDKGNDNSYMSVGIEEDYDHKEFYKWN